MNSFFFIIALFCYVMMSIYFIRSLYAMASILETVTIVDNDSLSHYRIRRTTSMMTLVVGASFHAFTLVPYIVASNGDVNFNLASIVSLTSLLMLIFSILFTSYRPIIVLNVFAAPVAIIGLILGYTYGELANHLVLDTLSISMKLHVLLSVAAYSALLMAAIQAVLLLLQNRELKHKTKTRVWVKLVPALQTMEKLLFDMIIIGFVLLTIALVLGWCSSDNIFNSHFVQKTIFSLMAWIVFAGLIFGHWRFGWRGKLAVNMTLWGFALLAMGFVGTKLVIEFLLT